MNQPVSELQDGQLEVGGEDGEEIEAIASIEAAIYEAISQKIPTLSVARSPESPHDRGMVASSAVVTVGCRRIEYSNFLEDNGNNAAISPSGIQQGGWKRAKAYFVITIEVKDIRTHNDCYLLLAKIRSAISNASICLCSASSLQLINEEYLGLNEGIWTWGQTFIIEFITSPDGNGMVDECQEKRCFRLGSLRLFAVTNMDNKPGVLSWQMSLNPN